MIRYLLPSAILFFFPVLFLAQPSACDQSGRYLDALFPTINVSTETFGTNTTANGKQVTLMVDIYQPEGDTASYRPCVVLAFGGSFVSGTRADMAAIAKELAARGYVVASIDYRLYPIFELGIPDSLKMLDAAIKATADMRGAIRWLRSTVSNGNPLRISAEWIFAGGYSAGSIAALHAAYLDENDSVPVYMQKVIDNNGGLEGNTGDANNLQYSSKVKGVINLAGGLFQKNWMKTGDPFLASYHGTADEIVPFSEGVTAVLGIKYFYLFGSAALTAHAESLNIPNVLVSVPGALHVEIVQPKWAALQAEFVNKAMRLFKDQMCLTITSDQTLANSQMNIYPNPVSNMVTFSPVERDTKIALYNANSQLVRTVIGVDRMNVDDLPDGVYWVQVSDGNYSRFSTQKLVIQRGF